MASPNVKFKCVEGCGRCCTNLLIATPTAFDIARVLRAYPGTDLKKHYTMYDFNEFRGKDKLSFERRVLRTRYGKHILAIVQDDLGCVFLDPATKFCVIYDERPLLCRVYPFEVQDDRYMSIKLRDEDGVCPLDTGGKVSKSSIRVLAHDELVLEKQNERIIGAFNRIALRRRTTGPWMFLDLVQEVYKDFISGKMSMEEVLDCDDFN